MTPSAHPVDYQYGAGAHPVDYVYNTSGQLTELHQYRNDTGTNKTTVKMIYDPATGLLEERRHYSDATNYKAEKYECNALDRVSKRAWARTSGSLTTTYNYSVGSTSAYGGLTGVVYSDATPDVTYTHDRMGRVKTVTDVAGTRQFLPDDAYGKLLILEEDLDTTGTGKYGNLTVRYPTETGSGATLKGRSRGVDLGTGTGGGFSSKQAAGVRLRLPAPALREARLQRHQRGDTHLAAALRLRRLRRHRRDRHPGQHQALLLLGARPGLDHVMGVYWT